MNNNPNLPTPENEEIKDTLIEKILSDHEPDQVLIDILKIDLYILAEEELKKLNTKRLLEIVLERE